MDAKIRIGEPFGSEFLAQVDAPVVGGGPGSSVLPGNPVVIIDW